MMLLCVSTGAGGGESPWATKKTVKRHVKTNAVDSCGARDISRLPGAAAFASGALVDGLRRAARHVAQQQRRQPRDEAGALGC